MMKSESYQYVESFACLSFSYLFTWKDQKETLAPRLVSFLTKLHDYAEE